MEGKLDGCCDGEAHESACASEHRNAHAEEGARVEGQEGSAPFESGICAVPWTLRDVILASVLFVPVGLAGTFGLGFALARLSIVDDETLAIILGSTLLPVSLLAGAWLFGVWRHKVSLAALGFRRTSFSSVALMSMAALAVGLTATGLYALLMTELGMDMLVPDQNLDEIAGQQEGFARLPIFVIVGVLAPFAEEVFFRGFLLAALLPVMGRLRGAVVSAAVFSAAHLNVSTLFPIFVMGMLLAWLYLRTGSIWPSIAAHAAQNLLALTFLEVIYDTPAAFLQA